MYISYALEYDVLNQDYARFDIDYIRMSSCSILYGWYLL